MEIIKINTIWEESKGKSYEERKEIYQKELKNDILVPTKVGSFHSQEKK